MGRGKKVLKVCGFSCLGLIVVIIILSIIVSRVSTTTTDFEGTAWQEYKGEKSTPKVTVFAEQSAIDKKGKPITPMRIDSNCSPKTLGSTAQGRGLFGGG